MPQTLNQRRIDTEKRLQDAVRISRQATEYARLMRQQIRSLRKNDRCSWHERLSVLPLHAHDREVVQLFTQTQRALLQGSQYDGVQEGCTALNHFDHLHQCLQAQACGTALYYLIRMHGQMVGHAMLKMSPQQQSRSAVLEWNLPDSTGDLGILRQQAIQEIVDQAFYTHGLQHVQSYAYANDFANLQILHHCGFVEHAQPLLPWMLPSAAHNLRFDLHRPVSFEAV